MARKVPPTSGAETTLCGGIATPVEYAPPAVATMPMMIALFQPRASSAAVTISPPSASRLGSAVISPSVT